MSTESTASDESLAHPLVLGIALGVFASLLVRTAWMCDDAYISFRVADNLVHGYGLRWNVAERVQAFSNPLWTLTIATLYFFTRDVYYTGLVVSLALSLAAAWLLAFRVAATRHHALLALVLLSLSKAFVDYSTSGLENPLTHLLLVAFFVVYFRDGPGARDLLRLSMLASLAALNRLDALVLVGPPLLARVVGVPPLRALKTVVIGFLPLVGWMAISLVYYGFPLPNTFYAKVRTGIQEGQLVRQGLVYLYDSLSLDPLTLLVILLGATLPFWQRVPRAAPLAVALVLDLVYVTWVGGDFMSGRFLAAPFLVAVVCLARGAAPLTRAQLAAALTLAGAVALLGPSPTFSTTAEYFADRAEHRALLSDTGITDERAIYYRDTGLLRTRRGQPMPRHWRAEQGRLLRVRGETFTTNGQIGMLGFFAGPGLHILDGNGLTDAFIARLPAHPGWRIGHFGRYFPPGYEESMRSGDNLIADPALRALYKRLRHVTRGRLLDPLRLLAIWDLDFGAGGHLADQYFAIHSRLQRVSLAEVAVGACDGGHGGSRLFSDYGIEIDLGPLRHIRTVEASLESHLTYKMQCMKEGVFVAEWPIPAQVRDHTLALDESATRIGCDRLRVFPVSDNEGGLCSLRIIEGP